MLKKINFGTQKRFSIRKLTVGACSVCLGVFYLNFTPNQTVLAADDNTSNPVLTNNSATTITNTNSTNDSTDKDNETTVENLVKNGDFSQTASKTGKWTGEAAKSWDSPWIPTATENAKVEVEDGKLHISSDSKFRAAVTQTIKIDSSKKYVMDYDVETKDLEGAGVRVRTRSLDDSGKEILPKEQFFTPYTNKTSTKHINQQFQFSPETKQIKFEVFFENSTGDAYFDNISFKEYVKKSGNVKEEPKAENGEVNLEDNKYYLTNLSNADYKIEDSEVATVKNNLIIPKKSGSTKVLITKDQKEIGQFMLNISDHQQSVYDKILDSWENVSLGNENYDDSNPYMKSLLDKTESDVANNLSKWDATQESNSIFSDVTDFNKSANITTIYRRLEQFSQVLTNKSSKYYENGELALKLKDGMSYLYAKVYNENKDIVGNWWDYQIGVPRAIVNILTYANLYFSDAEVKKYLLPVDKFLADPTHLLSADHAPAIGGNATDLSKVTILAGALKGDSSRIQKGVDVLLPTLTYVEKGNGFYKDGSYIDHVDKDLHGVAYTGAYGNVLMDGFSQIMPMISNTEFALPKEETDIVYGWTDQAYFPIVINGELMDMTRGRSISRATAESHAAAIEALRGIVRIAQASDANIKSHLLSVVKGKIANDTFYVPYQNLKSYTDIALFNKLLTDKSIITEKGKNYIQFFNNMDKFVYNNVDDSFSFAISMFSDKTKNYEDMNNENRHGWYTSDGMIYLYNGDLAHYSNGYWPTIDPYKLPGTTELTTKREDGSGQAVLPNSFVGATKLGEKSATVAMDFINFNKELTARKAWFIFGDKIVFLTTDIQNNSNDPSVTTVENRKISDQNRKVYVNGKEVDLTDPTTETVQTLYIDADDNNQRIGYIFLKPLTLEINKDQRTHSWREINYGQSDDQITNTFLTAIHTTTENGENIAYVLVPNKDQNALKKIQADVKVVEQTNDIQAVYDKENNMYGVVKYNDNPYMLSKDLVLKQAGIYIIKKINDGYELSFSHPRDEFDYSTLKRENASDNFKIVKEATEKDGSTVVKIIVKEKHKNNSQTNDISKGTELEIISNSDENNNATTNSDQAAVPIIKYLYHNAYLYDQAGKRTNTLVLKRFNFINTYGKLTIAGKKYYRIDKAHYVAANNIDPIKRTLKRNSFIYDEFGKLVKKTTNATKKGRKINTYGSIVKINGKKFYTVGKNQFIKAINFKK
ncbi:hypothetical protein FC52_GL001523 [Lactobacillus pasteurii DSM 23907 = CRBIP 24.76]|uniref:Hyaluronidase n=1 Tax=Lactobacillus pasteurii DSM 23907 = CRBIP 24.76 TaxID=1423790 RepID=I7LAA9_9LACO|nr:polysaccharide lyase family 8 super-sandwich domain-containing protein [Lactobacillus pasteurii]KRK07825.1 hypothetical protein FC52_GL001523 [Lactobacillus pasteurii DSM 23907 = CRBIP 24.76]TDG77452.1 hypothetical protein C5L33_000895 [Lactobacillus pasteurii]CCI84526.1 Hyaluronidase [Lactobacillus pasteurii DSM 23907 = CRBIP 24.76]